MGAVLEEKSVDVMRTSSSIWWRTVLIFRLLIFEELIQLLRRGWSTVSNGDKEASFDVTYIISHLYDAIVLCPLLYGSDTW